MTGLSDAELLGNTALSPPASQTGLSDAELLGSPAGGGAVTPSPQSSPSAAASASTSQGLSDEQLLGGPAPKPKGGFVPAFVTGLTQQLPESFGEFFEMLSHDAPERYKGSLTELSRAAREKATVLPGYETRGNRLEEVVKNPNMQDALTWATEAVGQGASSTVLPIGLGAAGFVAGTPFGPAGQAVGAIAGGVAGGLPQNAGEVYKTLKDEGVDPVRAKNITWAVMPLYSALDAGGAFLPLVKVLGVDTAKKLIAKAIGRQFAEKAVEATEGGIAKTVGKGFLLEGGTEAAQTGVKLGAVSAETGKPFFTEKNAWDAIEDFLAGGLTGVAFSAGGHVIGKGRGAPDTGPGGPAPNERRPATPEEIQQLLGGQGETSTQAQEVLALIAQARAEAQPEVAPGVVGATAQVLPQEGLQVAPGAQEAAMGVPQPQPTPPHTPAEQTGPGPLWFSKAEDIIRRFGPEKASAQEYMNILQRNGVKKDELYTTGLGEWLTSRGANKVSGDELSVPTQGALAELTAWREQNPGQKPPAELLQAVKAERAELSKQIGQQAQAAARGVEKISKQEVMDYLSDNRFKITEFVESTPHNDRYNALFVENQNLRQQVRDLDRQIAALNFNDPRRAALTEQQMAMFNRMDAIDTQLQGIGYVERPQYEQYLAPGERRSYHTFVMTIDESRQLLDALAERNQPLRQATLPATHFGKENNVAHVRVTVREDNSGKLVAYIEEMQSDWHQVGREKGYLTADFIKDFDKVRELHRKSYEALTSAMEESMLPTKAARTFQSDAIDRLVETVRNLKYVARENRERSVKLALSRFDTYGKDVVFKAAVYARSLRAMVDAKTKMEKMVPDAPYKMTQDWTRLLMERTLRWAADNNIERVAWTNPYLAWQYPSGAAGHATLDDTESYNRLQGMKEYYGQIVPGVAKNLARKYGGTLGTMALDFGNEDKQEVQYIQFDKRAQWNFQRNGFSSFMKSMALQGKEITELGAPEREVNIPEPRSGKVQVFEDQVLHAIPAANRQPVHAAAHRFVEALEKIAKRFDMNRISVVFQSTPITMGTGETATGRHIWIGGNKEHIIQVDLSSFNSLPVSNELRVAELWATLMHEFGHGIMYQHFDSLPRSTQLAIQAAYDKFLSDANAVKSFQQKMDLRMPAITTLALSRASSTLNWNALPQAQKDYWIGFNEWFADQVARWATTEEQPLTIVDKALKGIADLLKAVWTMVSKQLGLNFRADVEVSKMLNEFMLKDITFGYELNMDMQAENVKSDQRAISSEDPEMYVPPRTGPVDTIKVSAMAALGPGSPAASGVASGAVHAARFNWFYKWMAGLDQLGEANPNFAPLWRYIEAVRRWHRDEVNVHDAAVRIRKDWRNIGREQGDNLTNFMNDMVNMEYLTPAERAAGVTRNPSTAERNALIAKHNVQLATLRVYDKIQTLSNGILDLSEKAAIEAALRTYKAPGNAGILMQKITEIQARTQALRERPFFPFMRFGRHFVLAKDAAGNTTHFETFEWTGLGAIFRGELPKTAPAQQRQRLEQLRRANPTWTVKEGILPDSAAPFVSLPPILLEQIRNELHLTPLQNEALENIMYQHSTAVKFPQAFKQNYTPGHSMDYQRSFARYFFHAGRYVARVTHAWALLEEIRNTRLVGGNTADRIAEYLQDHMQNTILDAKGDWGILKGGIFLWAMGYVPAAATQNLTQTPMITFPFLSAKFGEIKATRAMTQAMRELQTFYKRGTYETKDPVTGKPVKGVNLLYDALDYGVKSGTITESQASELAAASQSMNLAKGYAGNKIQRGWQGFMEKSAWMFEMAEQWNRRIAFRAAYRLASENPTARIVQEAITKYRDEYNDLAAKSTNAPWAQAVITAMYVVNQTQYEYARWARPRFMRGSLPGTIFVFKKYMQSTLWMLAHNKSDVLPRYLFIAALMGGLAGIPGYDDLKEILKAVGYWLFGKHWNVEHEMRDYVQSHFNNTIPPDMILGGLARRGFGIPALLDLLGSYATGRPGRGFDGQVAGQNVPFPVLDRHRAITMGPILPVELGKVFYPGGDIDKVLLEQTQRASGAVFSVGFNILKAIMDNKLEGSDPKRWERAIPRQLADITRTWRAFSEGRERTRGGPASSATIAEFNWRDPEQAGELLAMLGGYNNLRVQAKWDSIMAKVEVEKFYDMQRSTLLGQLFEARKSSNPGEVDDVLESIRRFNRELPDWARGRAITADTARKSLAGREREVIARERGVPVQRSNVGISRHVDELFPETTVDVRRVR